jgi:hypothetical protein
MSDKDDDRLELTAPHTAAMLWTTVGIAIGVPFALWLWAMALESGLVR